MAASDAHTLARGALRTTPELAPAHGKSVSVPLPPPPQELHLGTEMASSARLAVPAAPVLPEPRTGPAVASAVHFGASGNCRGHTGSSTEGGGNAAVLAATGYGRPLAPVTHCRAPSENGTERGRPLPPTDPELAPRAQVTVTALTTAEAALRLPVPDAGPARPGVVAPEPREGRGACPASGALGRDVCSTARNLSTSTSSPSATSAQGLPLNTTRSPSPKATRHARDISAASCPDHCTTRKSCRPVLGQGPVRPKQPRRMTTPLPCGKPTAAGQRRWQTQSLS